MWRFTYCGCIYFDMSDRIPVTVITSGDETVIEVERGSNLRETLLKRGFLVYGTISQHANCGGRGLCGTCGVEVEPAPKPVHWHDAAAARFGYPRLSCCMVVEKPLTVRLLDKYVWGQVLPRQRSSNP